MAMRQPGRRSIGMRRGSGQALIEFTLILVPLVLLAFGGVALYDIARVQIVVDRAATEAARAAAATRSTVGTDANTTLTRAQAAAEDRMHLVLDQAGLVSARGSVSVQGDFARPRSEDTAVIAATVDYTHTLSATSRMVLKPWFPDGLAFLKGHAHEAIPRYRSA